MLKNFIVILCVSLTSLLQAQENAFLFNHITNTNGLSQSSVIAFKQDRLGQMWIGTRDGLNKYDGNKITIYRRESGNPKSLSNDHILSIAEDLDGNIWVGTYNGLNKYNPITNTFTRFYSSKINNAISNSTIWDIKVLSNGNIWLGTDNGITIYNKSTQKFTSHLHDKNKLIGTRINSILETSTKAIYIGSNSNLYKAINPYNTDVNFKKIKLKKRLHIQQLIEAPNKDLLIATRKNRIQVYNTEKKEITDYFKNININSKITNFRQLVFDKDNQLWAGTYRGLIIVSANKKIIHLKHSVFNNNGLSKNSIKSMYKDSNGAIWIGTFYGGVNIWNKSNNNFKKITQSKEGQGLNYNVVSSIENCNNKIAIGTEGGGLNLHDNETGSFEYITTSNSKLQDNNIKSLMYTSNQNLWVGTFNKGIQIFSLKQNTFKKDHFPESLKTYIKNTGIYVLKKGLDNTVWIGTFRKGLIKYNTKTKSMKLFWKSDISKTALSNNLIRTIGIDSDNLVWVGTEKGLNKINNDGSITKYFYDEQQQYGEKILNIYIDKEKQLWVSVKSKGLYKYNGNNFKSVTLLSQHNQKPSVQNIIEDNNSNLWLSTNHGIICYNKKTQKSTKHINTKNPFTNNEFNNNSCLKTEDGKIYFGSPNGIIYFNTNNIATSKPAKKVILTDLQIRDGKNINYLNITGKTLPNTKSITLNYKQSNFSIHFTSPNFSKPQLNKYKYRLKGLEKQWNVSNSPVASYTIQKYGNYTFEVTAANTDDTWNQDITSLDIQIKPAPWLTWWAFLSYALILFSVLFFYISILKAKSALKHKLELEQVETKKTKELNEKKIQFFTNISHEFRTPLALILGPLQQILENYKGDSETYKKIQTVENNASKLLQLINRLMDFRKLEKNAFKLEAGQEDIIPFLKEIHLAFIEYAKIKNQQFEFVCSINELLVYFDRDKLERLFYNLISNAFRYTPKNGKITLKTYQVNNNVIIELEDTGIGIEEEHIAHVFNRFFEIETAHKSNTDYTKGTGIGLAIVKDIANLHQGEITVKSKGLNTGSTFKLTLPLGKTHLNETQIIKNVKTSDDISLYKKQINVSQNIKPHLKPLKNKNKPSILLAEDNNELRYFIKNLLVEDYNIIEAENGKKAYILAKKENPELIISDVVMPSMTGIELCTAIKTDIKTSHIPIILLTSRSSIIHKLDGLESGADQYLSKPFNIKELKIRIHNILLNRELLQEKFKTRTNSDNKTNITSSIDEALYQKAVEIVKKNISSDIFDIATFASALGLSRTMLFTKIKAWSNFTPNEFINHYKLQLAAQLLEQGDLNISQISYKVGYKSSKHFSKSFKKQYGETPSAYAKKFKLQ